MSNFKGADLLMKSLSELDVKHVFGMGGHGCMGLCDGLYKADKDYGIKGYIIHDESVGAAAAGGYFKATGKPGVLLVTNGPGMMQAIPGLVEQAMENSALLVICGDIPTVQWGYGAEEELDIFEDDDQTTLYRGFAKRVFHVAMPEQIPMTIARAYTTAMSGRTGVVLVNVPVDVQSKQISEELLKRDYNLKKHTVIDRPRGGRAAVERAAELLLEARRPMIVCGVGAVISDASEEVKKYAPEQKYLRGLYTGGTYMDEAASAMIPRIGTIWSNCPIQPEWKLEDSYISKDNSCVDYGEEEFTLGRPHPAIDPSIRKPAILREAMDPEVAVIVLDFILTPPGHMDPTGYVLDDVKMAQQVAEAEGRHLTFIASVLGTTADLQDKNKQERQLREAGVIVCQTNYRAAVLASEIIRQIKEG